MTINAQIERITPEIATALLESNHDNRKVSDTIVNQYASDMAAGRWKMTGQPIIIADNGSLNDGQHRLWAVMKSGAAVDMLVIRGTTRDSRDAIDTGKARSSGDVLQMFHIPDGNGVAALAQCVISWERTGRSRLGSRTGVSKADVIARAKQDERLIVAMRAGKKCGQIVVPKHAAFVRYVVPDSPKLDEFLERLADGACLEAAHPVLTIRQWFLRHGRRVPDAQAIEALLRAWCAFRDGRNLTIIKLLGELPTP